MPLRPVGTLVSARSVRNTVTGNTSTCLRNKTTAAGRSLCGTPRKESCSAVPEAVGVSMSARVCVCVHMMCTRERERESV